MSRTYKAFDDNSDHAAAYYVRGEEARCAALADKNAYRPLTWIGPIAAYDSEHQHTGCLVFGVSISTSSARV